jgi:hypothetical protein
VPQHTGGVIRLATPTVVINGAMEQALEGAADDSLAAGKHPTAIATHSNGNHVGANGVYALPPKSTVWPSARASGLTRLHLILSTRISNAVRKIHDPPIHVHLAQQIARQAILKLRQSQEPSILDDDLLAACATWFGLRRELDLSPVFGAGMTNLEVHRLECSGGPCMVGPRSNYDGHNDVNGDGATLELNAGQGTNYALIWRVESAAGIKADCRLDIDLAGKQQHPSSAAPPDDPISEAPGLAGAETADPSDDGDAAGWKRKYLTSERMRAEERDRTRRKVLEAVL